jgi:hypothetical protein
VYKRWLPRALPGRWDFMVSRQQVTRGAQRSIGGMIAAALIALPSIASAQSGDGFLFKKPNGSFSMRIGYEAANTSSEPFIVLKEETTVGARSFDALNLGFDFNMFLSRRVDLTFTLDVSSRTKMAEYREWEEDGRPIVNEATLDRVAFGSGFRYNFVDRGRQISALAFIPTKTIPYVGATGGILWYEFGQEGDFVEVIDDSTGNIFSDALVSDHYGLMGQAFAGVERRLNARWSLVGETRFTHSTSRLENDYAGMGKIDLSGLAFTVGATVRF